MLVAATAVAAAPTAAFALPNSALDNADATMQIGKTGVISANGAAVEVPFSFSCPVGQAAYVSISLVESVGDGFASGGAYRSLTCGEETANEPFYLQANAGEGGTPFRPGAASVVARMETYPVEQPCEEGCEEAAAPAPAAPPAGAMAPPGQAMVRSDASGPGGYSQTEVHATITLVKGKG